MKLISKFVENLRNKNSDFIIKNQFFFLIIIVISLGVLWRFWGMGSFKAFSTEELAYLKLARQIIQNNWLPDPHWFAQSLFSYNIAAIIANLGVNAIALRLLTTVIGIIGLIFFFLFTRNWFNKQVALIATLLMATNTTMIIASQIINPIILIITLQLLILYLITLAFREKKVWLFLSTGLFSLFGMLISPLFVVTGILIFFVSLIMISKNKKVFSLYKFELFALILPIFIGLCALLYYERFQFSYLVGLMNPGTIAGFYLNIGKNILTLFSGSQYVSDFIVSNEPILDPFVAISSICGIIYAFFHSGKRKHQFLLLWLFFSLAILSLASTQNVANISLLLPPIFIFSGISLDYLLTSWVRTFPYNKTARVIMTMIFSIFLFLSIYYNFQKYFYAWQGNNAVRQQYTQTFIYKK